MAQTDVYSSTGRRNRRASCLRGASLCFSGPRLVLAFSLLLLPGRMLAQVAPAPDAPPTADLPNQPQSSGFQGQNQPAGPDNPQKQPQSQPSATLRVTTNLVNLFFLAHDSHGKLVTNLTATDCTVYEDGAKQTLQHFSAKSDRPLTLGILLDTSLSQQRVLPTEQQAGDAFLRRVLRPKDEAFLISFDVDVDMLADLTGSVPTLEHAMDRAQINSSSGNFANGTIPSIGKPKGTLLYDAVYLAANDKLRHESGRKALILLTDGQDEGSEENLKSAMEAAQKADAVVYVLLINDPGIYGTLDFTGAGAMHKLTKETGGRVFEIGHDGRKIQAAFEIIENELHAQYQASYTPTNHTADGGYRRIRVDCVQNDNALHVQARKGYYAAKMSAP